MKQWAADAAAPGEQLGVQCLAQGSHLSRGHFLPEPGFEPTTLGYLGFQVQCNYALGNNATMSMLVLGLGDMSKNVYLCIFWLICSILYISLDFLCFYIWIKQINMLKKGLKLHSNIVTLQSKNYNNAFKPEVKFTKLKMKIIKKH